jgi:hypothetical protein
VITTINQIILKTIKTHSPSENRLLILTYVENNVIRVRNHKKCRGRASPAQEGAASSVPNERKPYPGNQFSWFEGALRAWNITYVISGMVGLIYPKIQIMTTISSIFCAVDG